MRVKTIFYSSHFARAFQKLPKFIQRQAIQKETIFRQNCFEPRLKTHKLKGELKDYWSFSINHSYRILFEFIDKEQVGFIDLGNHNIYK